MVPGRQRRWCSRGTLLGVVLVGLSGCGLFDDNVVASTEFVGAVAADEPNAALIARDMLREGGTAADAAVALYFAQAVTQPSMATLGGGGVCLVFSPNSLGQPGTTEVLEFYPRASRRDPEGVRRPSAVPGNVRGFFALHARYGRMRIERLLAPAEKLARFGVSVSRAFARDLQTNANFVLRDAPARLVFAGPDGNPLAEGDRMVQQNLAAVLSVLRTRGPADFYTGRLAAILAQSVIASGGTLTLEELRDFRPQWTVPLRIAVTDRVLLAPPPPAAGGIVASQAVALLIDHADFDDLDPDKRPHMFAESIMLSFQDRRRWSDAPSFAPEDVFGETHLRNLAGRLDPSIHNLQEAVDGQRENRAGTGFVVMDRVGLTVACSVTPNNVFGVGLMARGTGILLAAAPDIPRATENSLKPLGPILVIDADNDRVYTALAGSGGIAYPSAAAWTLLGLMADDPLDLRRALEVPRLHHSGAPDLVYYESRVPQSVVEELAVLGHTVEEFPTPGGGVHPGRINAIHCIRGFPRGNPQCSAAADDRGAGVAFVNREAAE